MASNTNILINIGARTAGAVKGIKQVEDALGKGMSGAQKWEGRLAKASQVATVALAGLGAAGFSAVKAAEEAATANARLAKVYDQMGYGENAAAAQRYADELSKTIGVEDEVIKAAQAKLATFRAVARDSDLMGRSTKLAADLAAAGFGDMSTVSVGLGKALQDPVKGMQLLTRQGSLTKAQQEKIAAEFERTGDKAAAQESILKALEKQVGGVAEATANDSDKLRVAFGEISEAVGAALLPAFQKIVPYMQRFAEFAQRNAGLIAGFGAALAGIAGTILLANGALKAYQVAMVAWNVITKVATGLAIAFRVAQMLLNAALVANPIGLIVAAVAAFIAILVIAYQKNEGFRNLVQRVWEAIKTAVAAVMDWIVPKVKQAWELVQAAFSVAVALVRGYINTYVTIVKKVWSTIQGGVEFVRTAWNNVLAKFTEFKDSVKTRIDLVVGFVANVWGAIQNSVASVKTAWNNVLAKFTEFKDSVKEKIDTVAGFITSPIEAIKSAWEGLFSWISDRLSSLPIPGWAKSIINRFVPGINIQSLLPVPGQQPAAPTLSSAQIGRITQPAPAMTGGNISVFVDGQSRPARIRQEPVWQPHVTLGVI